jgi:hypothetical protein
MTSHTALLQMLCNVICKYPLYNDGVKSTSSNIYVNNSVLTMVNISREDMGSYALQAENNGGSTFHNFVPVKTMNGSNTTPYMS